MSDEERFWQSLIGYQITGVRADRGELVLLLGNATELRLDINTMASATRHAHRLHADAEDRERAMYERLKAKYGDE